MGISYSHDFSSKYITKSMRNFFYSLRFFKNHFISKKVLFIYFYLSCSFLYRVISHAEINDYLDELSLCVSVEALKIKSELKAFLS